MSTKEKSFYGSTYFTDEDLRETDIKNKVELKYYKIKSDNRISLNENNKPIYGIEVVKKEYINDNEFIEEIDEVSNVTDNQNSVNNILELLKNYKVTPISLRNVLEDLKKNIK